MRYILAFVLLGISFQSLGASIKCYNNGRMVYSEQIKNVMYEDGLFAFVEAKTGRAVMTSADCVVRIVL